jgi:NADP-dependent 3-hydroxy acid dehydrogenase YdfG
MELKGRVAAITGAASGIGEALARHAVGIGMAVALADRDTAGLVRVRDELAVGGAMVVARSVDIRDQASVRAFAADAETLGDIALLFANAGAASPGPVVSQSVAETDLMIDVNLKGTLNTLRAFAPLMTQQAEASRIVITGSQASLIAYPGIGVYGACKHGLWAIAETLRGEMAATAPHVAVSLLVPGPVATGMSGQANPRPGEIQTSMAPPRLAEIAFSGIADARFWIFSHPECRAMVAERMAAMLAAFDRD